MLVSYPVQRSPASGRRRTGTPLSGTFPKVLQRANPRLFDLLRRHTQNRRALLIRAAL